MISVWNSALTNSVINSQHYADVSVYSHLIARALINALQSVVSLTDPADIVLKATCFFDNVFGFLTTLKLMTNVSCLLIPSCSGMRIMVRLPPLLLIIFKGILRSQSVSFFCEQIYLFPRYLFATHFSSDSAIETIYTRADMRTDRTWEFSIWQVCLAPSLQWLSFSFFKKPSLSACDFFSNCRISSLQTSLRADCLYLFQISQDLPSPSPMRVAVGGKLPQIWNSIFGDTCRANQKPCCSLGKLVASIRCTVCKETGTNSATWEERKMGQEISEDNADITGEATFLPAAPTP